MKIYWVAPNRFNIMVGEVEVESKAKYYRRKGPGRLLIGEGLWMPDTRYDKDKENIFVNLDEALKYAIEQNRKLQEEYADLCQGLDVQLRKLWKLYFE